LATIRSSHCFAEDHHSLRLQNEVVLVRGLVTDPHSHDDLVVTIDRRLVVARDPPIASLDHQAVGIRAMRWALALGSPAAVVDKLRLGVA
jgi:hypothetical protein